MFSRLEVFYSRNKTELTLHAAHADGTKDVVLYGPERRQFWRDLDHGPRTPADGQEAPLTHRVLRMTQPQPMPDGRSSSWRHRADWRWSGLGATLSVDFARQQDPGLHDAIPFAGRNGSCAHRRRRRPIGNKVDLGHLSAGSGDAGDGTGLQRSEIGRF